MIYIHHAVKRNFSILYHPSCKCNDNLWHAFDCVALAFDWHTNSRTEKVEMTYHIYVQLNPKVPFVKGREDAAGGLWSSVFHVSVPECRSEWVAWSRSTPESAVPGVLHQQWHRPLWAVGPWVFQARIRLFQGSALEPEDPLWLPGDIFKGMAPLWVAM